MYFVALEGNISVKINHSLEQCLTSELTANEWQDQKSIKVTEVFPPYLLITLVGKKAENKNP